MATSVASIFALGQRDLTAGVGSSLAALVLRSSRDTFFRGVPPPGPTGLGVGVGVEVGVGMRVRMGVRGVMVGVGLKVGVGVGMEVG